MAPSGPSTGSSTLNLVFEGKLFVHQSDLVILDKIQQPLCNRQSVSISSPFLDPIPSFLRVPHIRWKNIDLIVSAIHKERAIYFRVFFQFPFPL
ncbi:hypothetical protein RvY_14546 [Ramazzottius varieornatus]|uniref:Uncharacterized protein n=1 Tax=Ramazzottius varieornatus TaxID=947166 RepID=A0A1D1VTM0_RAMVA|nr:hypothetical protein RvY_14546 [Ramazzottius varieornatus]